MKATEVNRTKVKLPIWPSILLFYVTDSQETTITVAGAVCVSANRLRLCRSLSSAAFLAVAFM